MVVRQTFKCPDSQTYSSLKNRDLYTSFGQADSTFAYRQSTVSKHGRPICIPRQTAHPSPNNGNIKIFGHSRHLEHGENSLHNKVLYRTYFCRRTCFSIALFWMASDPRVLVVLNLKRGRKVATGSKSCLFFKLDKHTNGTRLKQYHTFWRCYRPKSRYLRCINSRVEQSPKIWRTSFNSLL